MTKIWFTDLCGRYILMFSRECQKTSALIYSQKGSQLEYLSGGLGMMARSLESFKSNLANRNNSVIQALVVQIFFSCILTWGLA